MKKTSLSLILLWILARTFAPAESPNIWSQWMTRTSNTQAKQPAWAVPLVTTYTGLIQVVRTDVIHQIASPHTTVWNYDNSKGVNIVPWANTEIAINLPPYISHSSSAKDGAGDMSFLGKYRIATGNAKHGNYNISAFLLATIPTGSYKNGSTDASVAPGIGAGKGFGNFDIQSTLSATLPIGNPAITTAGRPIAWNTVVQYRIGKLFWPELESNATFYKGGTSDQKMQEFLTPGLIIGKCALHPSEQKSRPGLAFGAGMQIATSHFHTYNHSLIMTARWIF